MAGEVQPPSEGLTGPTSPRRLACAPGRGLFLDRRPKEISTVVLHPIRQLREALRQPHAGRSRAPRARVQLQVELLEHRTVPSGVDVVPGDPKDWPMFSHDPAGTRYNHAETRLRPDNVDALQELWRFPTDGSIASTPTVVNDVVYAADSTGAVYAV